MLDNSKIGQQAFPAPPDPFVGIRLVGLYAKVISYGPCLSQTWRMFLDIIKALHGEAANMETRLSQLRQAIAALSGRGKHGSSKSGPRKGHKMSAAARAKIGRATKARWAKFRAEKKAGK